MSKPKVIDAVDKLDYNGFYNGSKNLGDIRTSPECLDSVFENGIYIFIGGKSSPTDTEGSYKWSLRVYACETCTNVIHEAERILSTYSRIVFTRNYDGNSWSSWISGSTYIVNKTLPSSNWILDETLGAYYQVISVEGLKPNNKIDFDADITTLSIIASPIIPVNEDGVLKAYTSKIPEVDITLQLTISTILST